MPAVRVIALMTQQTPPSTGTYSLPRDLSNTDAFLLRTGLWLLMFSCERWRGLPLLLLRPLFHWELLSNPLDMLWVRVGGFKVPPPFILPPMPSPSSTARESHGKGRGI